MDETRIESLEIRLTKDLTAKLSVKQARTLMEQLQKLFGEPKVVVHDNYIPYRPFYGPLYTGPIWQVESELPKQRYGDVWCHSNLDGTATAFLECSVPA